MKRYHEYKKSVAFFKFRIEDNVFPKILFENKISLFYIKKKTQGNISLRNLVHITIIVNCNDIHFFSCQGAQS